MVDNYFKEIFQYDYEMGMKITHLFYQEDYNSHIELIGILKPYKKVYKEIEDYINSFEKVLEKSANSFIKEFNNIKLFTNGK